MAQVPVFPPQSLKYYIFVLVTDEAEMDEYMGCQKYLEFKVRTLKSSMKEEEIKQSSEYQREHREEQHCEEMKKVDQRRQRERDFQEELKKIMEAEKVNHWDFLYSTWLLAGFLYLFQVSKFVISHFAGICLVYVLLRLFLIFAFSSYIRRNLS